MPPVFWIAVAILVGLLGWVAVRAITLQNQKRNIGTIRCKRCNHVGPVGVRAGLHAWVFICSQCQSEDWVKVDQINPV